MKEIKNHKNAKLWNTEFVEQLQIENNDETKGLEHENVNQNLVTSPGSPLVQQEQKETEEATQETVGHSFDNKEQTINDTCPLENINKEALHTICGEINVGFLNTKGAAHLSARENNVYSMIKLNLHILILAEVHINSNSIENMTASNSFSQPQ